MSKLFHRRGRSRRLQDMLPPARNNFAIVRLVAALSVLVSHCYLLQSGLSTSEPLRTSTGYSLGSYGVQVFFVLSGILVTQSLMRSTSILDFATARVLRILPGLVVCVLAVALFLGPILSPLAITDYFASDALYAYLAKTLFLTTGSASLPQLFSENPLPGMVNQSLWTLKYEVFCYALVGVVGGVLLRYGTRSTRARAVLGAWIGVMIVFPPSLGEGHTAVQNAHYFTLFFGMGALAYLARSSLPLSAYGVAALFLFFVLALGSRWLSVAAALFVGYGAIYVASIDLGPLRQLANRYDLSYGTYVYGFPVTQTLLALEPTLGVGSLIALTIVVVLPISLLSWIFVERPALAQREHAVAYFTALHAAARRISGGASVEQSEG